MKEEKLILELTNYEWRLLVGCLNTARSVYLDEGKPIDDVNILLIKALDNISSIINLLFPWIHCKKCRSCCLRHCQQSDTSFLYLEYLKQPVKK